MSKEFPKTNQLENIKEIWEEKHKTGDWQGGTKETPRVVNFFDRYEGLIGPDILDLGAGTGRNAIPLIKRGYSVTCLELTDEGLKQLKNKLGEENLEAKIIVQADQSRLPFRDNSFDTIISIQTFQFLVTEHDASKAFSEVSRVLKPGGIFFLRVRSQKFNASHNIIKDNGGSVISRGYSLDEIQSLAKNNNFEIIEPPIDSYRDNKQGNVLIEGQWNVVMRKI